MPGTVGKKLPPSFCAVSTWTHTTTMQPLQKLFFFFLAAPQAPELQLFFIGLFYDLHGSSPISYGVTSGKTSSACFVIPICLAERMVYSLRPNASCSTVSIVFCLFVRFFLKLRPILDFPRVRGSPARAETRLLTHKLEAARSDHTATEAADDSAMTAGSRYMHIL